MFLRDATFHASPAEIRALLAHASDDDEGPPARCGVAFIAASGSAVALDGHRLAVLSTDDGATGDAPAFIAPRMTLASAAKVCPSKGIVAITNGQIDVYADRQMVLPDVEPEGDALATLPFEGPPFDDFPAWESVIPALHRPNPCAVVKLNPAFLAALALVSKACDDAGAIMYAPPSATEPTLFTLGEVWRVVLMPMAMSEEETEPASAGVKRAAKAFRDSIPKGTTVTISTPGCKPVSL